MYAGVCGACLVCAGCPVYAGVCGACLVCAGCPVYAGVCGACLVCAGCPVYAGVCGACLVCGCHVYAGLCSARLTCAGCHVSSLYVCLQTAASSVSNPVSVKERGRKLGHRRVDESGVVTYKKVTHVCLGWVKGEP